MTHKEFNELQKKYNRPRTAEQQEKYRGYEKKIEDIMKKPPNDRNRVSIGINELVDDFLLGSRGYFYDPKEELWCVYRMTPEDRSNDITFYVYWKEKTEEAAFQSLYKSFEEKVKSYEWDLECEKNNRMTQEEFLEWYGKENRKEKLAEKGPYQILWNRKPKDEAYAIGYYLQVNEGYIKECIGDLWVAYVVIDGKCRMEMKYKHETRAIYMMSYWIQLMIEGYFDED